MDYDDRPLDGPWSKRPDSQPDFPKPKKSPESKRPKEKKPGSQTKSKKSDERPRKAKEKPEEAPKRPEDCPSASASPKKEPKAGQLQELLQPRNIQAVVMAAEILNQRGGKARKYLKF